MASSINNITFGTDGLRGIIARDFTYDTVRKFAQGIADYLAHKYLRSEKPAVAVGYDRRFMSDRFAEALAEVLIANNIKTVISSTPVPTPALSLATAKEFGLGVMITASHNNALYNGIKIKQDGRSAPSAITAEIENYGAKAVPLRVRNVSIPKRDFLKEYCGYIKDTLKPERILPKLKGKIVVDFMYGSAAEAAGIIAGKNIVCLREKHDPLFGGIMPEPVEENIELLAEAVKKEKALFGIAIDGDGDRIAVITEKGKFLSPCQTAPVILRHLISKGKFKGKVAQTVAMGYLTKRIAEEAKIPFEETPVGFKFVAEKMLHENASFISDESGGYAWKGGQPETDAIASLLMMAELIAAEGKPLSSIVSEIEEKYGKSCFARRDINLPKIMANKHSFAVKAKKKLPKTVLGKKIADTETADGLKIILENNWWLLLRPSATEQKMRAYAESENEADTEKLLDLACKLAAVK